MIKKTIMRSVMAILILFVSMITSGTILIWYVSKTFDMMVPKNFTYVIVVSHAIVFVGTMLYSHLLRKDKEIK